MASTTQPSRQMQPIRQLADYCDGDGNPIIGQVFYPARGWVSQTGYRKRASIAWLRKLRRDGAERISVLTPWGTAADFSLAELMPKTGLKG